jgi:hypothetical protein
MAPARSSGQKAEEQWRTYLHTKEGLAKEGLTDSISSSSGEHAPASFVSMMTV